MKESVSKTIETELMVPQIMPSSDDKYCRVVQISYEVRVEGSISDFHGNAVIIIPITIGAIPLNFNQTMGNGSAPHQAIAASSMQAPYPDNLSSNLVPIPEIRKFSLTN